MGVAFDKIFAAALIDNGVRHKILGRTLRPFCFWHLLLLQVLESPFVTNGNITLFDLKNAVAICTLGYRQSKIRRPIFPLFIKLKRLKEAVEHFMVYVGDYLSKPEYVIVPWDTGGSKGFPRLPPTPPPNLISTVFNAAHGARVSIKEAWEMPIGEAYIAEAMYFQMVKDNQLDFMDDETREFQARMKEQIG